MNRTAVIITILILATLMVLRVGLVQRHELFTLRREQQRLLDQLNAHQSLSTSKVPVIMVNLPVSRELLQLRNRVNMLTHRNRELAGVQSENERLRLLITERQTNGPTALPPGYIRRSQARMVGYNTPQDTLQSFLWAIKNHDTTNVLLALTPEQAEWYQSEAQRAGSFEKLFEHSDASLDLVWSKWKQPTTRLLKPKLNWHRACPLCQ